MTSISLVSGDFFCFRDIGKFFFLTSPNPRDEKTPEQELEMGHGQDVVKSRFSGTIECWLSGVKDVSEIVGDGRLNQKMVDVYASVGASSRGVEGYFGLMYSTMSQAREADANDGLYMRDESQFRSSLHDARFRDNKFDSSGLRVFGGIENRLQSDLRMVGHEQLWIHPHSSAPGQALPEDIDTRNAKGLVTAIDAIDKIIGPRKKKSRNRTKARSERTVLCEKCGSTFTSVGNLNRHRRVSHQGVRVFCDFKGCKQVCVGSVKF